jgi:hypothetical protein
VTGYEDLAEKTWLPAAMAAGVTDRLMSFADLFDAVMGYTISQAA